jgi:hypothetical protein
MYEKIEILPGEFSIKRTDSDGTVWWIPEDLENAHYQKYLEDTDGGLPMPKKASKK